MYSLPISAIRIAFMAILAFVFIVTNVSAQTSIVGSDGVRYEVEKEPGTIFIKKGESLVIKQASCSLTEKTFLYKKETCTSAVVITEKDGALTQSGGEKTIQEIIRSDVALTLIGMMLTLVGMVVLISFRSINPEYSTLVSQYLFFSSLVIITILAINSGIVIVAILAGLALLVSMNNFFDFIKNGKKSSIFLFVVIYEVIMLVNLWLIA